MTLCNPDEVWIKLQNTFQAVSETAIDSKLTQLQQINMDPTELLIAYVNRIHSLASKLSAAGDS